MLIMGIDLILAIGWMAVLGSTLTALPQLLKTHRTKSSDDLSLGMILIAIASQFAWFIYGWGVKDIPLMVSAITPFFMYGYLLYLYRKYEKVNTNENY